MSKHQPSRRTLQFLCHHVWVKVALIALQMSYTRIYAFDFFHVLINRVFRNRSSIPNVIDIFQFEIIRIYAIDIDLWVKNYNEFIKG